MASGEEGVTPRLINLTEGGRDPPARPALTSWAGLNRFQVTDEPEPPELSPPCPAGESLVPRRLSGSGKPSPVEYSK